MTVRGKIIAVMGILVLMVCIAYALTTRVYMGSLFHYFQNKKMDADYLNASDGEQIEILRTYILGKMRLIGFGMALFFAAIGLIFCIWISGVLTRPLRKLVAAIERVAQGDLEVNIPVETKDEYGKVTHTFNDMTLRLGEAEAVRKRLVADVAHELRTPLSVMQLKLENFQEVRQAVSPESLLPLHDEVIRLSGLVEDLHILSLAEAGRLPLARQPIDLSERLARIVEDIGLEAEVNGLVICVDAQASPVVVMADPRRITQVFINLLTNAIRYTPSGGKISVEIIDRVVERQKAYACVSVSDTGIGIPSEEIPHLFDRFYRVEEARSRHTGGTGLGLSIAHHFVKAHGGFIHVTSQPGQGTTFHVYLPAGIVQSPAPPSK